MAGPRDAKDARCPAAGTLIRRFNPATTAARTRTSHVFYYKYIRTHTRIRGVFIVTLRNNNNIGTHSTKTVMPFLIIFGPKKKKRKKIAIIITVDNNGITVRVCVCVALLYVSGLFFFLFCPSVRI